MILSLAPARRPVVGADVFVEMDGVDDAMGIVVVIELLDDISSKGEEGNNNQHDAASDNTGASHDV